MDRKEYEKWYQEYLQKGGQDVFYRENVSEDLLLENESYLDIKSGCRRGHHCWEIGFTDGPDSAKHINMYSEGKPFFGNENSPVNCTRCGAWGNVVVEIISEGNLSPDPF